MIAGWGSRLGGAERVEFEMRLLMIAGVVAVAVGGGAIWFGIPVKEFSFGNTMILAGAIAICSGLLLIGLGAVVRELKAIKRTLMESAPSAGLREPDGPPLPAGSIAGRSGRADRDAFDIRPVVPEGSGASEPLSTTGFRRESVSPPEARDTPIQDVARPEIESGKLAPEVAPPVPPPARERRNLLFTSSRREREKARAGAPNAVAGEPAATPAAEPVAERRAEPHPSFDRGPGFSRTPPPLERSPDLDPAASRRAELRAPPPAAPAPSAQPAPAATVVKSGAVDGMAYSLYSDGSIVAQMPEGMMRFTSIEHLRAHLDRDR